MSFQIKFRRGGPTVRHMMTQLVNEVLVQEALGVEFTVLQPYIIQMSELTDHFSNQQLQDEMNAYKTIGSVNVIFALVAAWGVAVFWSITARGAACRKRTHASWKKHIVPTGETIQVIVLSSFFQIILSVALHMASPAPSSSEALGFVYLYAGFIGVVGACFIAILNAWIRGESLSLRNALSVGDINRLGGSLAWEIDEDVGEDFVERMYCQVYEPGSSRTLGGLAQHDWEKMHLDMERRMGIIDLSDKVFDKPKEDASMLASYLNHKLSELITGKQANKPSPVRSEVLLAPVEVPDGLPRATLRDALLQWRLRHAAHPDEAEAMDWILGQLDPSFKLEAVKVSDNIKLRVVEALVQYQQKHAELQLDAAHSVRMLTTLQQLGHRFRGIEVDLPDDGQNTVRTRELITEALRLRIEKSKTEMTQEEGALLQMALHSVKDAFALVAMPYNASHDTEAQLGALMSEIGKRADEVRDASADYMYDDEIFTPVTLISRTKPPDAFEEVKVRRGKGKIVPPPSAAVVKRQVSMTHASPHLDRVSSHGRLSIGGGETFGPTELPDMVRFEERMSTLEESDEFPLSPPASPPDDAMNMRPLKRAMTVQLGPKGAFRSGWSQPGAQPGSRKSLASDDEEGGETPRTPRPEPMTGADARKIIWRILMRRLRRDGAGDHEKMPCWKQYTVLFIGSVVAFACTVTVITLFTIIPPITQYFSIFSAAGSIPISIVLHFVAREIMRYIRKRLALRRGRQVMGLRDGASAYAMPARKQPFWIRASKMFATSASSPGKQPDPESGSADTDLLKTVATSVTRKSVLSRSHVSAHLVRYLDETKSFADHVFRDPSSVQNEGEELVKHVTGVARHINFASLDRATPPSSNPKPTVSFGGVPGEVGKAAKKDDAVGRANKILGRKDANWKAVANNVSIATAFGSNLGDGSSRSVGERPDLLSEQLSC